MITIIQTRSIIIPTPSVARYGAGEDRKTEARGFAGIYAERKSLEQQALTQGKALALELLVEKVH